LIQVRCFGSFDEARPLRDEVNALNLASSRPDPFASFELLEAFHRFDEFFPGSQSRELWFLAAFSEGRLIGYLALKKTRHRVLGVLSSSLSCLVVHDTDRPHVTATRACLAGVSEAIYAYLLGRSGEWSLLEFYQQDSSSSLFPPPAAIALRGYVLRQWPCMENCTIDVHWATLASYLGALDGKFRANLRRQMRRLLESGTIEWLESSDPLITPALLDLYRSIEPRSWKAQALAGIGRSTSRVDYFKALLEEAQPMRISIQVLLVDGVPISGLIAGAFERGLYALSVVYDSRLSRVAPGSAMLLMAMRQAIDGQYRFLNLLSGFRYYKVRWLGRVTETRIAQIYRIGGAPFWHRMLGDLRRRVARTTPTPETTDFNPVRRGVSRHPRGSANLGEMLSLSTSAAQREHFDTLTHRVRSGTHQSLSASQLSELLDR
jgi:hypothetical protein